MSVGFAVAVCPLVATLEQMNLLWWNFVFRICGTMCRHTAGLPTDTTDTQYRTTTDTTGSQYQTTTDTRLTTSDNDRQNRHNIGRRTQQTHSIGRRTQQANNIGQQRTQQTHNIGQRWTQQTHNISRRTQQTYVTSDNDGHNIQTPVFARISGVNW
jgi:hypothetical protein